MDARTVLSDVLSRVEEHVHGVADGLSIGDAVAEPEPGSNSVAWELWHLARVQDAHIAELLERDQIYIDGGWAPRFGLRADPLDVGYRHSPEQAASVNPDDVEVLVGYYDAVDERTRQFLESVTDDGLDRIVDRNWDPPVTLGVRLVSIADDSIQHAGQAAYVKGLIQRR